MPIDGSGIASKPAGTTASPNTTIASADYNATVDDIYNIFNTADALADVIALNNKIDSLLTPWVSYTPTFQGFGTVTTQSVRSRRVGGSLEVQGYFVSGTPSAAQGYMTLGFNGGNGNAEVLAGFDRSIVGTATFNRLSADQPHILATGGEVIVTFGIQSASYAGNQPVNGNVLLAAGNALLFTFSVPIEGWN